MREIITGIINWLIQQSEERMEGLSEGQKKKIIRMTKFIIQKKVIDPINIEEIDQALTSNGNFPELNFKDPYSKIVCMILYLYSMELGTPPLYAEANRCARDLDFT